MMQLVKYEAACRAVAEANSVDEVKDIMDKSIAIELYGKKAKNKEIEAGGFEIRMKAERRLGQLLSEKPPNKGQLLRGTKKEPRDETPTIADMGIDKKLSSRSKKVAALPDSEFENRVAIGREKIKGVIKEAHVANNSGENEWYTPKEYIESARKVMGEIDLDPASTAIANKTVKAATYFTQENDGLNQMWSGNVWMNPPYSQPQIRLFCEKFIEEIPTIPQAVVITNNATETNWLQPLLIKCGAVCFLKGRVKFVDKNGDPGGAPLQGQVILYFGSNILSFVDEFTQYGHVMSNEV